MRRLLILVAAAITATASASVPSSLSEIYCLTDLIRESTVIVAGTVVSADTTDVALNDFRFYELELNPNRIWPKATTQMPPMAFTLYIRSSEVPAPGDQIVVFSTPGEEYRHGPAIRAHLLTEATSSAWTSAIDIVTSFASEVDRDQDLPLEAYVQLALLPSMRSYGLHHLVDCEDGFDEELSISTTSCSPKSDVLPTELDSLAEDFQSSPSLGKDFVLLLYLLVEYESDSIDATVVELIDDAFNDTDANTPSPGEVLAAMRWLETPYPEKMIYAPEWDDVEGPKEIEAWLLLNWRRVRETYLSRGKENGLTGR